MNKTDCTQDDYKQKLKEILEQAKHKTKTKKCPSSKNDLESLPMRCNSNPQYKASPFRSTANKSKTIVNGFEVEAASDVSPSVRNSAEKSKNRNIRGDTIDLDSKKTSNKKKRVTIVDNVKPSEFSKKALKRQSTPYYSTDKKRKRKKVDEEFSFPSRNLEAEFNDENDDFDNDFGFLPIQNFTTKRLKKCSKNHEDDDVNMEAGELICEDQDVLSNIHCMLISSDSEDSNHSEELNITSDYSAAEISCNSNGMTELRVAVDELQSNSSLEDVHEVDGFEGGRDKIVAGLSPPYDETDLQNIAEPTYTTLNDKLLVTLPADLKLHFHGIISVTVLYGEVKVLGYSLNPSSGKKEMFSPRGTSFLHFETKEVHALTNTFDGLPNSLVKIGMKQQDVQEFCKNLKKTSTVILCEKINDCKIAFLEKYIAQQIFSPSKLQQPRCVFKSANDNWNILNINSEWDTLISRINSTSSAFICGGKSVGKSTLLRYMLNSLLTKHKSVLVIDLDPGQPEFTVSGCISAAVVSEPVFGPNYTHLRKPARCLFLPNINISYDPDGYLNTVKELMQLCSDLPKLPTIINYMGFTRGLGLEIFSAVVACTHPTHIIEIQSLSSQRNFKEQLSYMLISSRSKLLAGNEVDIPKFCIYRLQSMADTNEGWHLEPRQIREMCVLSYFSQMLPTDVLSLTDNRIPVYTTALSEMKIICDSEIVNSAAVINGNLVALCSKSSACTSYTCHGWGIVRGINTVTNELLLLTPLLPDDLELVDHIILGSVSLPPSLYMTSDGNTGLVPYVCIGEMDIMGRIPKRSHLSPNKPVKQD